MKRLPVITLIVIGLLLMTTSISAEAKDYRELNTGLSYNMSPMEFEVNFDKISLIFLDNSYNETFPVEEGLETTVMKEQTIIGIGYIIDFLKLKTTLGVHCIYHKQGKYTVQHINKEEKIVTLIDFSTGMKLAPFISTAFMLDLEKIPFSLSVKTKISSESYDGKIAISYIFEKIALNLGYWYWSKKEWHNGFFVGFNLPSRND